MQNELNELEFLRREADAKTLVELNRTYGVDIGNIKAKSWI